MPGPVPTIANVTRRHSASVNGPCRSHGRSHGLPAGYLRSHQLPDSETRSDYGRARSARRVPHRTGSARSRRLSPPGGRYDAPPTAGGRAISFRVPGCGDGGPGRTVRVPSVTPQEGSAQRLRPSSQSAPREGSWRP
jgi:hypothetical protein